MGHHVLCETANNAHHTEHVLPRNHQGRSIQQLWIASEEFLINTTAFEAAVDLPNKMYYINPCVSLAGVNPARNTLALLG